MTDLTRLKVSLTKHGAHKVARLIQNFPRNQILNNVYNAGLNIDIDKAQTRNNLSIIGARIPEIWDEVRQYSYEHIQDLVLLAIIFNHHEIIDIMVNKSTGNKRGVVYKADFNTEKSYTNFANNMDEFGFATYHSPDRVEYDLSRIFRKYELIPLIIQLLTLKLRKALWSGANDFIDECIANNFHTVLGVPENYFRQWLQRGTLPEIIEAEQSAPDEPEEPVINPFNMNSGHTEKSEGEVVINNASPKLKATLLHNKIQNMLYKYLISIYPPNTIGTEQSSGFGTNIDVVREDGANYIFYEIKTAKTVRSCIRQALSQLLEYSYWPDQNRANKLIIVSQNPITPQAQTYIGHLRNMFNVPIHYQQFDINNNQLGPEY